MLGWLWQMVEQAISSVCPQVSALHLLGNNTEIVKRWVNEIQEAAQNKNNMVQVGGWCWRQGMYFPGAIHECVLTLCAPCIRLPAVPCCRSAACTACKRPPCHLQAGGVPDQGKRQVTPCSVLACALCRTSRPGTLAILCIGHNASCSGTRISSLH
jgi:hypothetical protein